jgi:hypothetical protein
MVLGQRNRRPEASAFQPAPLDIVSLEPAPGSTVAGPQGEMAPSEVVC